MVEPNWELINEKKRLEINLGQAKNQASEIAIRINASDFEQTYKNWVRKLFKLNCELDDELLNLQNALNLAKNGTKTETKKDTAEKDKCPKCHKFKPDSWKFHAECGWKA